MTSRTTRTTVSFKAPFKLKSIDEVQPAGEYLLLIEEETIDVLSRLAYRRVATFLSLPSISAPQDLVQLVPVDQRDLDAALAKDRDQTISGAAVEPIAGEQRWTPKFRNG
jgi:hypothetical protein